MLKTHIIEGDMESMRAISPGYTYDMSTRTGKMTIF